MSKKTYYIMVFIIWVFYINYFLDNEATEVLYTILFMLVLIFFELLNLTDKK